MTALPASGSFAMVDPTHVAAVGPAAAILYARIEWRARETGEWTATRSELAAETGLTPAMIRTAVEVLRRDEWIETRRVSTLDSTLIWTPVLAGQPERRNPPSRDSEIRTTPPAESAIPSYETGRELPPTPADAAALFDASPAPKPLRSVPTPAELDAEFARFWELYPRKTAKKAARTAYAKARRDATVQQIAAGLHRQLPAMRERTEAGEAQYVPHPTTWLNQGRWDDEPTVEATRPRNVHADTSYDPAYAATLPPPAGEPRSWAGWR